MNNVSGWSAPSTGPAASSARWAVWAPAWSPRAHLVTDPIAGGQRIRVVGALHRDLVGQQRPVGCQRTRVVAGRAHLRAISWRVVKVSGWSAPSTRSRSASSARNGLGTRVVPGSPSSEASWWRVVKVSG